MPCREQYICENNQLMVDWMNQQKITPHVNNPLYSNKQVKVTKYYSPVSVFNPCIDAIFLFGNREVKIYTSHVM